MIPFLSLLIISSFYYFQLNNLLYNASIDFVEGYVVYNGLKLVRGENIYSHPTYVVPYPPLGYIFSVIGEVSDPKAYPTVSPIAKRITLTIAKIPLETISTSSQ